jgi:hypothetical protein
MRLPLFPILLAVAFAPMTQAAGTSPAITELAKQFDTHAVVMIGELHRSRELHGFLQQLLHDPAFICRVDDVVVEFGNSRLQAVADDYASGKPVDDARLQSMWRETAVPLAWNSPVYRQFVEAVRDINQAKLCAHPVRLVLADVPLDWAKIQSASDYAPLTDRDGSIADVVEREVLAKGHRALLVAGEYHAMKVVPKDLQDDPVEWVAAQRIEQRHPGALFSVVMVPKRPAAQVLGMDAAPPVFRPVHGTPLEDLTFQLTDWATTVTPAADGATAWTLDPDKHWPCLGDVVDGLLWVGGNTSVFPSPTIYLDPDYQRELRRRAAIIQELTGQDFTSVIDDLVRQAHEGGDGQQTNVPKN